MLRRTIGPNGPNISQICYGSMRLRDSSVSGAADWLCQLHDTGIDTHHSSHEYDNHALYLEGLNEARRTGRRFHHVVKLSNPSFDASRFDRSAFESLLDNELSTLGADTIANVQWLLRTPDVTDDQSRLAVLSEQAEEIQATFDSAIEAGKVGSFSVFPYSEDFAAVANNTLTSIALAAYLNLGERDYIEFLDQYESFIAIRPLGGGALHRDPATALQFSLLHPRVSTAVVSLNSPEHLSVALRATADLVPDLDRFHAQLAEVAP